MQTINHKSLERGYVVSDLHLFSPCSRYRELLPKLQADCSHYPVVVLNGDTFEIKRSTENSVDDIAINCATWLQELCETNSKTTFYYIIGNHDAHSTLTSHLQGLAANISNLKVVPHILTIGSNLFIHGDVIEPGACMFGIESVRERYKHLSPSKLSTLLAMTITTLRLNVVEYLRHQKTTLAERIISYVSHYEPQQLEGIKTIFFGHTHVSFSNFSHEGITFHNTGSFIKGLKWNPMSFELPSGTHQATRQK